MNNEEKKYAVLKDDGTIEFVPLARYVPAVLRGIDSSQERGKFDPVLNEQVINHHFQEVKTSVLDLEAMEEASDIEKLQKDILRWYKIENPVGILVRDLTEAECSPVTIGHYRDAANRYMRFVGYEPTFTHEELFGFINSLGDVSASTRQWNRVVLKCWWEAMGLLWPIRKRRIHKPHTDTIVEVPSFTYKQVDTAINLAKKFGTDEIRFYFCLVTVFAPRRIELANITQQNFHWENGTGTLKFNPHKHGLTRIHYISKELAPYLKYDAKPIPEWLLSRKFHEWCRYIRWDAPKAKKCVRGSWHAFRHSVNTALLEADVDSTIVNRWIGWRSGSAVAPMVGRYYSPEKLDEIVQHKHPFIKLWAKND